jgi:hypothetical protein
VIGLVASVVSNVAVHYRTKSTLDDTLDVFPCHGVGGMVGMIMTGIFARDVGLVYGQTDQFINQLKALVITAVFSFVGSFILYKLVDLVIRVRVTEDQEDEGLDITQHGEKAVTLAACSRTATGMGTIPTALSSSRLWPRTPDSSRSVLGSPFARLPAQPGSLVVCAETNPCQSDHVVKPYEPGGW